MSFEIITYFIVLILEVVLIGVIRHFLSVMFSD